MPLARQVITSINWVLKCVETFLSKFDAVDVLMVVGPMLLHALAMFVWTAFVGLKRTPSVAKATIWHLSGERRSINLTGGALSLAYIAFSVLYLVIACSITHRTKANEPLWTALHSLKAREDLWCFLQEFEKWKSVQLAQFRIVIPELQRIVQYYVIGAAWRTWSALHWSQKVLIVPPVFIFYLHLDLIPFMRKLPRWRRRRRLCHCED
ncbi:hypothetical protein B0H16DRAFT_1541138, partial [Mycena metata]